MCVVGGLFGFAILALWVRLFQVQYIRHDDYAAAADKQHVAPREIQAARGGIFDRDGRRSR
jgi:cell division protein FtsI/penicillin-binding protein 2